MQQVRATYKVRDSWWTVLLVDPVAGRLARLAVGRPWLTPNRLTLTAFLLGLAAAGAFLAGSPAWLAAGALLYHVCFVIDCVDGKLARLAGTGSVFGGWLDFFLDRVRVVVCLTALFAGQFLRTEQPAFLLAATGAVFLALFGYVNGAETDKARAELAGRAGAPLDDTALLEAAAGRADGLANRLRAALHRRRIRVNLVSGIEFEMAVLVIAPLLAAAVGPAALWWVFGIAAGLLVLFELALIGRFWLATRQTTAGGAAGAARVPRPSPRRPEETVS